MKDGKHVILYVDDDPDILDSMRMILEAAGYALATAATAEEGLRKYKEAAPDAIIVDLMMEEIDSGTTLVKELRLLGNTAPVFMLSSAGDQLSMITSYDGLGLAGVFQKPVQPDALLATLQTKLALA
jgi:DNA-binding response OmpR family regulator